MSEQDANKLSPQEQDAKKLSPQEMEQQFGLLAANAKEYAIFLVAPEGHLLCWNKGAEHLFGYRPAEIAGQHFSRFFSAEDVRSGQPERELTTALESGRADSVRWQVRKDGTRFWCASTVTPLLDDDQHVRSFAKVARDLSESDIELAQKERADGLADANRGKEHFLALLSHELRNPLSPILSALSIIQRVNVVDPILQQAGGIIERQVGHMVRLVDDLLDVSRITQGKLRLRKERVEFRTIVNQAVCSARPFIDARHHQLSVSLPTQPLWVVGDPIRLEQVAVNLLNNAAKYTEPCGFIRVHVDREGTEAVLRVRDNGVGIPPAMLLRIFELFTQVDETLSRSHGGLGVGLALVRTLVEMHDGRIQTFSAGLGKGSEFTVKLPALADSADHEAIVATPSGTHDVPNLRVLVVEDSVDSADSLNLLLRLHGHEVLVARDGPLALEMAPRIPTQRGVGGHRVAGHGRLPGRAAFARHAGARARHALLTDGLHPQRSRLPASRSWSG